MPIKIIEDSERLEIEIAGSVFIYRRATTKVQADAWRASTTAGETDYLSMALLITEDCLVDWKNIVDGKNKKVLFEREKIGLLPANAITDIYQAIMQSSGLSAGDGLGNLGNSSDSMPPSGSDTVKDAQETL